MVQQRVRREGGLGGTPPGALPGSGEEKNTHLFGEPPRVWKFTFKLMEPQIRPAKVGKHDLRSN